MADGPKFPTQMKVAELKLGDCVQCFDGPYGTGHVVQIDDDPTKLRHVTVYRPYATVGDFSYSRPPKVIPYTGHEFVTYPLGSPHPMLVYHRKEIA